MKFNEWLDVFIKEKVIDLDESFILDCEYYHTNIYYRTVINTIKRLSKDDKKELKKLLVKLDFLNGDVKKFLRDFSEAYNQRKEIRKTKYLETKKVCYL